MLDSGCERSHSPSRFPTSYIAREITPLERPITTVAVFSALDTSPPYHTYMIPYLHDPRTRKCDLCVRRLILFFWEAGRGMDGFRAVNWSSGERGRS